MAYSNTFSIRISNASDALFRAWTLALHNEIIAVGSGWTQTLDTGQMDFTTVLAPTTFNQVRGYTVYQMTGSPAWFMIIEWGSRSATSNHGAIYVTICTATNGAGGVAGGAKQTTRRMINVTGDEAAAKTCKIFAYASGLAFILQYDSASFGNCFIFAVERLKDPSGNDSDGTITPQGVGYYCHGHENATTILGHQLIDYNVGVGRAIIVNTTNSNVFGMSPPIDGLGTLFGNKVSLFPIRVFLGEEIPPMTLLRGHILVDVASGVSVAATVYGSSMTYYCFGTTSIRGAIYTLAFATYLAFRTA